MSAEKYRAYASQLVRNPDDPEALVNQFSVLSERKEYGKYYYWLAKRAHEIAPDEINAAFNYGSACHRTGRFKDALRMYLEGSSYEDMAEVLECDTKAIDNALQRVKRKILQHQRSREVLQ